MVTFAMSVKLAALAVGTTAAAIKAAEAALIIHLLCFFHFYYLL